MGQRARDLRRRVERSLAALAGSSVVRDAELSLRLSLLLPAESALEHVAALVERTQDVSIDAIDVLGKIFTKEAIELAIERVMRSPDERILRRVADHVLVPHLRRGGPWGAEARVRIEETLRSKDRDKQDRKRRWHLVHSLVASGAAAPERICTEDPDLDAVTAVYILQASRPGDAIAALGQRFGCGRAGRTSTSRALRRLLSSEDFYLRRAAVHLFRVLDFDFSALAGGAMADPAIEVRFSALKGLIHLVKHWPERRGQASDWLVAAIEERLEEKEEHFCQVALGTLKHIDKRRFWPRALASLVNRPVTFRIDVIHGLWDAEGLWAAATVSALEGILRDPAGSERLYEEVRDALGALRGSAR